MKTRNRFPVTVAALAALAAFGMAVNAAAAPAKPKKLSREHRSFFEKKIRAVLLERCYECHSTEPDAKIKAGLSVETREDLIKGGDTGPSIVPGKPGDSLFMETLRGDDPDLLMPPEKSGGKLPDSVIADFARWIKMGAPDPRTAKGSVEEAGDWATPTEKAKTHPFFKAVKPVDVPAVKQKQLVRTPVDHFILARLEKEGLKPSKPADKRTLIRRVYFDLIGYPPSPKEVDAFLADKSPKAYEKLVEKLLKSPRYGERWGRFWLDVARYGDTMGTTIRNKDNRYHYAWTYRDYVIKAFNDDKPYDQFLIEQLAADKLDLGEDKSALAALGFLTLGNRFNNDANQIIDDRIDVVGRGTMGLTVTCGRCHDHKFDPITMKDYYAWHGIFASSEEPPEKPLLGEGDDSNPAYREFKKELTKREATLAHARRTNEVAIAKKQHSLVGDYLIAAHEFANPEKGKKLNRTSFFRSRDLDTSIASLIDRRFKAAAKKHDPIFGPWVALSSVPKAEFKAKAPGLAKKFKANEDEKKKLNPKVARLFETSPESKADLAKRYGKLFNNVAADWRAQVAKARKAKKPAPKKLANAGAELLRQVLHGDKQVFNLDERAIRRLTSQRTDAKLNLLIRKVNDLKISHPGAPPRAMALLDKAKPRNSPIFLRGNPGSRGEIVKRQFLEILGGSDAKAFSNGSGRLELAKAIAAKDNPLTPRVMVNRIWLHHFGQGIVTSPSDFGLVGEPPSHPGLLDWLAWEFMENNWSIKHIHRKILLSYAWRQASDDNPAYAEKDQGNFLLWRQNRRRLDFEGTRDTLVAVSGTLDSRMGGQPVDLAKDPAPTRRAIYGLVDRAKMPGFFNTFDFASPDISNPQRVVTTVPQQALFLMNSPFVIQQAKALAEREDLVQMKSIGQRIRAMYRSLYQREPTRNEVKLGMEFVERHLALEPEEPEKSLWSQGYGWFDAKTKKVKKFARLPRFQYGRWEGSKASAEVYLDKRGGAAGKGAQRAAIRRWMAPKDAEIAIEGRLQARAKSGVRGRIVSSRQGEVASFEAMAKPVKAEVEKIAVKKGESLYFVVESKNPKVAADFRWAPDVRLVDHLAAEAAQERYEWLTSVDFSGPSPPALKGLKPWEKYAQVLLLSNETVFVN